MANRQCDSGKEFFWRQVVARWQRSGLGVRDFCEQEQLAEPSFYSWRRELTRRDQVGGRKRSRPKELAPRFVPVRVVPPTLPTAAPLEVVLGNGRVVRVPAEFDAALLRQLLAVLEAPPC